jgi:serine/threonine protein kinase
VHGDIKPENVLIFSDGKLWTGKLIDFGFSCLGTSDSDRVQVACTKPWQAPEHRQDTYFRMSEARQMDLYSFGMLVCRIFLSNELPFLVPRKEISPSEHVKRVDEVETLKSTSKFLNCVLEVLYSSETFDKASKDLLAQVFRMTLQHEAHLRAPDFISITSTLTSEQSEYGLYFGTV